MLVQEEYLLSDIEGLKPREIIEVFKLALEKVNPEAVLERINGDYYLFWDREETTEEAQIRIARQQQQEKLEEKRERDVLRRLKAKYETAS